MFLPKGFIKINLPLTERDYLSGNGEGVWVKIDPATRRDYDENKVGPGYFGILDNDSLYYPGLGPGEMIPFEMRGEHRPVADYRSFLSRLDKLTPEGKMLLMKKIAEHHARRVDAED